MASEYEQWLIVTCSLRKKFAPMVLKKFWLQLVPMNLSFIRFQMYQEKHRRKPMYNNDAMWFRDMLIVLCHQKFM